MSKTPGQIAYEHYWEGICAINPSLENIARWNDVTLSLALLLESAAQAVRAPLLEEIAALKTKLAHVENVRAKFVLSHLEAICPACGHQRDEDDQCANCLTSQLKELREAHGGAVLAVHSAVERAEALDREIAALRKSNAELVKSANEIFLVDPSANVPRFFAAVRELKSAITLATEPKP